MPTLATFNANNFFLRYRFTNTFPGDLSAKSLIAAGEVGSLGYVPPREFGQLARSRFVIWDAQRRELAARALAEPDGKLPDILCVQETENLDALRALNADHFRGHYAHVVLIDGWDPRNIDVGVLSRFPITALRSHVDELDDRGQHLFSRDCLEVTVDLNGRASLTLFVNHLKSKFVDTSTDSPAAVEAAQREGNLRRRNQAERVLALVRQRFRGEHDTALYAVVGDFNDVPSSPSLAPLLRSDLLVDVLARHRASDDRWTYYWRAEGRVQQIDYVLASKALAARVAATRLKTHIERRGLGYRTVNRSGLVLPNEVRLTHCDNVPPTIPDQRLPFRFTRYPAVLAEPASNISDHCPVKVWF
jgi:endonuclease/exonuclease/phosphatase family metal-dependent hydrolase